MYRKRTSGWLKHIDFLLFDMVCLEASFVLAYILRHGWFFDNDEFKRLYVHIAFFLILDDILVSTFSDGYAHILSRGMYKELVETFKHITFVTAFLIFYLYMTKNADTYSRMVFLLTWAIGGVTTFFVRSIWKIFLKETFANEYTKYRGMVIITCRDEVEEIVEHFARNTNIRYKILGICLTDECSEKEIKGVPIVAKGEEITEYLCRNWVDEVFISVTGETETIGRDIAEACLLMGITVHHNVAKTIKQPGRVQIVEKIGDYTVISSAINTMSLQEVIVKRIIDIVGSVVGLIFTAILFVFVAPAIYIKSPGPIFFKQWRVGKNGKKFQIYKFRSMYLDAEERKAELMAQNKVKDGMMFKMDNDPRIIGGENGKGIGNFIRNTSIDEFPQFLNVLKGDMSLVGTRPPTLDEWKKYDLHHRARMSIKPGLTGMWQVSGRSNITDFEEVVKLDTEYIMNWSIGKDIKILLMTVVAVLKKEGSS